jgi:hypothetical protein
MTQTDREWWTAAEPHRSAAAINDQRRRDVIDAEIARWQIALQTARDNLDWWLSQRHDVCESNAPRGRM